MYTLLEQDPSDNYLTCLINPNYNNLIKSVIQMFLATVASLGYLIDHSEN